MQMCDNNTLAEPEIYEFHLMMYILQSTNSSRYGLVYFVSKLFHKRKIRWSHITQKIS